jgi:hypothetical protein
MYNANTDIWKQGFMKGRTKAQIQAAERKEMWTSRMYEMLKNKNITLWDSKKSDFNKRELSIIEKAGYLQYLN